MYIAAPVAPRYIAPYSGPRFGRMGVATGLDVDAILKSWRCSSEQPAIYTRVIGAGNPHRVHHTWYRRRLHDQERLSVTFRTLCFVYICLLILVRFAAFGSPSPFRNRTRFGKRYSVSRTEHPR